MNALLRKEVRLLMPAWIAAMLQATLPSMLLISMGERMYGTEVLLYAPFGFGVLLLALASFGQEFSAGTFSILLAQPVSRNKIWRIKISLLALAVFAVGLSFLFCLWLDLGFPGVTGIFSPAFWETFPEVLLRSTSLVGLVLILVFATALWTTLLFRQVSAAFWFTILIPSLIATLTLSRLEEWPTPLHATGITLIFVAYSLAGFFWARWMFLRAQDTAWTGGDISLPVWIGFRTQTPVQLVIPKLKPLRAVMRKEFQSHHIALLISAALLVSHLVGIAVRKLEYDPTNPHKAVFEVFGFWWLLWFALPMIIGATVVAEERKLGTLESQLCLPVMRGWQFIVKFVMALLLGVFLGGVMPGVCEGFATWIGVPGEFPSASKPEFWLWLTVCCLAATGIVLVSIYASTLTRNLLQALGTAVLVGMLLTGFGVLVLQQEHFPAPLWTGWLGFFIGLPVLLATVIGLALKNFKNLGVGFPLWRRNLFVVLAAMVLIVVATTLVWNRVWELGMILEPAHGPARLTGAARPALNLAWGGKVFALLPDGRIWVEDKYLLQETGELESYRGKDGQDHLRKVQIQVPLGGIFIATSNWVQLASTSWEVVGIAADGTLWRLFRSNPTNFQADLSLSPKPERIGIDSDWKTVMNGMNAFFALKQDGSLWTWKRTTQAATQCGGDSDWTAIFASHQSIAGIKRDGSVWKWGWLQNSPHSPQFLDKNWMPEHPEPVLWYPAGGDWQTIDSNNNFDLLVKRDGTLWAWGHLPENILGVPVRINGPSSRFSADPVQIGTHSDIADIKSDWATLLVLKKDGTVYHNNLNFYERVLLFWGRIWKLSQHSDWIAIQHQDWTPADMALAADGTLSAWREPLNGSYQLLGPSRKPLWTLNIFAEAR